MNFSQHSLYFKILTLLCIANPRETKKNVKAAYSSCVVTALHVLHPDRGILKINEEIKREMGGCGVRRKREFAAVLVEWRGRVKFRAKKRPR
jgi:hypothetical protein